MPRIADSFSESVARRSGDVHGRSIHPGANGPVVSRESSTLKEVHPDNGTAPTVAKTAGVVDEMKPRFEKVAMPPNARGDRGLHIQNIMQLEVDGDAYIVPLGTMDEKKCKANFANIASTARVELGSENVKFAVRVFELRGQRVIGVWRVE